MHLTFADKNIIQIDGAQLIYKNFAGRGDKYNREGDRNFAVRILDPEIAQALKDDVNKYGAGWNVKIKPPREEGDEPFMFLPVKIKFNGRGPNIYVKTGDNTVRLTEETVSWLDKITIESVDLDIRPYDDMLNGRGFRAAYLQSMYVVQQVDRFADRMGDELARPGDEF